jgi:cytochrome c oxidase subunit IV
MKTAHLSVGRYVLIWAALLVLLVLTFVLARTDLGYFNNVVAIAIALSKMMLVVLFFMHVKYEKPLVWVFVCAGVIWLFIMFDLTLADYMTRPSPLHHIVHNRVEP